MFSETFFEADWLSPGSCSEIASVSLPVYKVVGV